MAAIFDLLKGAPAAQWRRGGRRTFLF